MAIFGSDWLEDSMKEYEHGMKHFKNDQLQIWKLEFYIV